MPLSDEDRLALIHDLALVEKFASVLGPRGIDGIFFLCEDCQENHFYEWDIMAANMRATLAGELAPVHEPEQSRTRAATCRGTTRWVTSTAWKTARALVRGL